MNNFPSLLGIFVRFPCQFSQLHNIIIMEYCLTWLRTGQQVLLPNVLWKPLWHAHIPARQLRKVMIVLSLKLYWSKLLCSVWWAALSSHMDLHIYIDARQSLASFLLGHGDERNNRNWQGGRERLKAWLQQSPFSLFSSSFMLLFHVLFYSAGNTSKVLKKANNLR